VTLPRFPDFDSIVLDIGLDHREGRS